MSRDRINDMITVIVLNLYLGLYIHLKSRIDTFTTAFALLGCVFIIFAICDE